MRSIDWNRATAEFLTRELSYLTTCLDEAGLHHEPFDLALRDEPTADCSQIDRLWRSATKNHGDAALLALYMYARCQAAWELATEYELITALIVRTRTSWADHRELFGPDEQEAVDLVLGHAGSLPSCFAAENALNCSCPVDLSRAARSVVSDCEGLLQRSRSLGAEWAGFRQYLDTSLSNHRDYFSALAEVAARVIDWVDGKPGVSEDLRRTAADLIIKELNPTFAADVYGSELRAHRISLTAMADRTENQPAPSVHIDDGRLVYCYPFSFSRVPWADILALRDAPRDSTGGPAVRDLELSEIWRPRDGRVPLHDVVSVVLPRLEVSTTAGGRLLHTAEIRLSSSGNHYVRIVHVLDRGVTWHGIYQGLRRGSTAMGRERVVVVSEEAIGEGRREWGWLSEFARDAVQWVRASLASRGNPRINVLLDLDDTFHVLVELRSFSTSDDAGTIRPATARELLAATRPLLLQPVKPSATALEEWVCYPDPGEPVNLLQEVGFATDLVVRTENTSIIIAPGAPHWKLLTWEEMVEFVASLPALLTRWRHELDSDVAAVLRNLPFEQLDDLRPEELHSKQLRKALSATGLGQVETLRMQLRWKVERIESQLARLHSADLVRSSANRRFIDRLYEAAGLPRQEAELRSRFAAVESLYERLQDVSRMVEEERNEQYRLLVETVLAVIAASSLVEVFGLLNDLHPSWAAKHGDLEALVLAAWAVLVGTVVVGANLWKRRRRRS